MSLISPFVHGTQGYREVQKWKTSKTTTVRGGADVLRNYLQRKFVSGKYLAEQKTLKCYSRCQLHTSAVAVWINFRMLSQKFCYLFYELFLFLRWDESLNTVQDRLCLRAGEREGETDIYTDTLTFGSFKILLGCFDLVLRCLTCRHLS